MCGALTKEMSLHYILYTVPILMLAFKPVGSGGLFIEWTPAVAVTMVYPISYKVVGTLTSSIAPPVTCGGYCNTTITGLVLGQTYVFSVGTFPEQQRTITTGEVTEGREGEEGRE